MTAGMRRQQTRGGVEETMDTERRRKLENILSSSGYSASFTF